jgi:transcriptional regulator with XRE-family HTH domain
MPRRLTPDPLAAKIGTRVRELRQQAGLTLEKLAYESEVRSKGYMSDIEKGLAFPTIATLQRIAEHLGVDLLDLVTFPGDSPRQELVALTRSMKVGTVRKLVREAKQDSSDAPTSAAEAGGRRTK